MKLWEIKGSIEGEIKKLEKRVKALRELMDKFMAEKVKPELTEIEEIVKKHNDQYIVKDIKE